MTEIDLEMQSMRREIVKLKQEISELKELHYCDLAEKSMLRRQVECLMEKLEDGKAE